MFKIGEKIVCINPSISLVKNEIYTVIGFIANGTGVILKEVKPTTYGKVAFWDWRFRKIDYEFANNVLAKLIEEVKNNELVKLN